MSEENKQEEVKEEVSQEEVPSVEQTQEEIVEEAVKEVEQEVKDDRPERNYKAEIARKNAEIERLKALASHRSEPSKHDPQDLNTWQDHELKAVLHSNDPAALALKDKAEEILLDRRVQKVYEKKANEAKKVLSETRLVREYPESLDPTSEFALKMEEVMEEFSLQQSPAGRLAAAKIVSSEMKKGASNVQAKERKAEANRIASVKGQMVDGDRSKSVESANNPKKQQRLIEDINHKDLNVSGAAFGELLKQRGLGRNDLFKS